ncbi:hypothetical protein EDB85DRAFT_1897330 [Lactarius pseudohatsudake]|nr:hypothetical protein EDB85DRAFT_1897330 [Lactarius pseudohatsudake]
MGEMQNWHNSKCATIAGPSLHCPGRTGSYGSYVWTLEEGEPNATVDDLSSSERTLNITTTTAALESPAAKILGPEELHACYVREMRYICVAHTLVDAPDVLLNEEEAVLGTVFATTTQPRWRSNYARARDIRPQIFQKAREDAQMEEEPRAELPVAWRMWCWAQHQRDKDKEFIESFSLIVLGVELDCLKRLGGVPEA